MRVGEQMCTDEVLVEGSVPERRIVRSDASDVCGMVRLRVISYQSPRPTAPDLPETMARSIRVSFQGLAENIRNNILSFLQNVLEMLELLLDLLYLLRASS